MTRSEMIVLLKLTTTYNSDYLHTLSDGELEKLYIEKVENK